MRYGEGRRLGSSSQGGRPASDQFPQQIDDGTSQSASVGPLDHLGSHLRRLRCPKCSSQMISDENTVQKQAVRIGALKAKTSCAPCPRCGAAMCMACARLISNARNECCPMARLYVIWVLLCGVQADKAENRGEESARDEARLGDMIAALNTMLPRPSGVSHFDKNPPSALVDMLRQSPLFIRMATMVRQGTTQDLALRQALYEQVFAVIETLQGHNALADLVHGDLRTYPTESMLFSMTMHPSGAQAPETFASRPLRVLLQDLRSSARGSLAKRLDQLLAPPSAASRTPQRPLAPGNSGSGRSTPSRGSRPEPSGTSGSSLAPNGSDRYHREHCVEVLDDDVFMEHFPFLEVQRMQQGRSRPGRMKRLIREIGVLSSSLPPGIWVKHAAGRPDAFKVLIEGPRDTPYEFGVYEFHILCPDEYPQKPPAMVWSPRACCPHRINATLHDDGIGK
ncbi:Gamma-glutamyltransferase [Purpureocillium takamizusanense]|uniref:Gamma-glutamyltransferase n=1 Tax=Purpureocillium takamizusanense TaxID=2060973 RepID=A0A9Q8V9N1_9HYPO|nr:Gamma-glutamyltransferase [Purpureocillium takamizusanense]UNI17883.1 Gamma-glutamyltransferase [Purpureocillium takamizusanense]